MLIVFGFAFSEQSPSIAGRWISRWVLRRSARCCTLCGGTAGLAWTINMGRHGTAAGYCWRRQREYTCRNGWAGTWSMSCWRTDCHILWLTWDEAYKIHMNHGAHWRRKAVFNGISRKVVDTSLVIHINVWLRFIV